MSISKRNLVLPIVNLDHSERNFVFCLAGFKNDLTSSVFMQSFGKAGVALYKCVLRGDLALVIRARSLFITWGGGGGGGFWGGSLGF